MEQWGLNHDENSFTKISGRRQNGAVSLQVVQQREQKNMTVAGGENESRERFLGWEE